MCHRYRRDSAITTSHRPRRDVSNITTSQRPVPRYRTVPRLPLGKARVRASRQKMPAFTPGQKRQNCRTRRGTKWVRGSSGNSRNKRKQVAGKAAYLPGRGFRDTRTVDEQSRQGIDWGERRGRMFPSHHGEETENTQKGLTRRGENPCRNAHGEGYSTR
jgi:hypothetical protein